MKTRGLARCIDALLKRRNRHDQGFIYLPRQYLQVTDGGVCVERYGGEAGDKGAV